MPNELTVYKTDHGEVTLSPDIVKKYLVPSGTNVSDQEVQLFLKLCQYQGLNPFLREVYLIKYGTQPANMVTGKEVFTKRAQANPNYAGIEAGITVMTNKGDLVRREGSMKLPGEVLIGGWAKVHIKGHDVSSFDEVSLEEYTGTGPLWKSKPATMIRKVAIVHALREAFPEQFEGLYSQEEISHIDSSKLPEAPVQIKEAGSDEPNVVPVADADGVICADAIDITPVAEPEPVKKPVPLGDLVIPFGKHKGRTISYICNTDRGWLEWYEREGERPEVQTAIGKYLAKNPAKAKVAEPVLPPIDADYQQTSINTMPDASDMFRLPWDDDHPAVK